MGKNTLTLQGMEYGQDKSKKQEEPVVEDNNLGERCLQFRIERQKQSCKKLIDSGYILDAEMIGLADRLDTEDEKRRTKDDS